MVRFFAAVALLLGVASAHAAPAPYVLECSPSSCTAPDGTTQPAGTFTRTFEWDGATPYALPSGTVAVPYTGQTVYAPPVNQVLANLSQAQQAFNTGLTITSTGTPALNGVYPIDTLFMLALHQEELCLLATTTEFCNLQTTRSIPDITGTMHTFNKTQFNNFLLAIGSYLDSLIVAQLQLSNGVSATLPAASATIP